MIRILTVTFYYKKGASGGAGNSLLGIIDGLSESNKFKIESLFFIKKKNLKRFYNPLGIGYYIFIPKIIKKINKFKPQLIITQTGLGPPSIIVAKIKRIPIISIIRDPSLFCPKHVDIISYGRACNGLESRKICYDCINFWRTLRVLIGNKPTGWNYTLKALFSTIGYKLRFFFCKLNILVFNHASINLVASELMKSILSVNIKTEKIKVVNITPVRKKKFVELREKKNQLLFIIPSYDPAHKGLNFVFRLIDIIPKDFKIVIVGQILSKKQIEVSNLRIINLGRVNKDDLNKLYQNSKITIVPSFYNEAFGRVIIESVINRTPVISSPSCGANYFFKNKGYIKVVPLRLSLWKKEIDDIIENPPEITINDINSLYKQFSLSKSKRDFSDLIKCMFN